MNNSTTVPTNTLHADGDRPLCSDSHQESESVGTTTSEATAVETPPPAVSAFEHLDRPKMMVVAIGSTNPVKVNAVMESFSICFPSVTINYIPVVDTPSGVANQPMSDEETRKGAMNRAIFAAKMCETEKKIVPDYSVGPEGGCQEEPYGVYGSGEGNNSLVCYAWMAVLKTSNKSWGISRTASFMLPKRIQVLVKSGLELGKADDVVFKRHNSKQKDGAVGILSHGLVDRKEYYKHALILALIPFQNPDLYDTEDPQ